MKPALSTLTAIVVALCGSLTFAWDEDWRCRTTRRELGEEFILPSREEQAESPGVVLHDANLRGYDSSGVVLSQRELQNFEDFHFQVKMFWKEGLCWQDEWRERRWCMSCEDECREGEKLNIQKCRDREVQRFIWEPIPGTGAGKLRPKKRPNLCWEQKNGDREEYRLRECDSSNKVTQLITGFTALDRFELFPYGQSELCFSQQHDPKSDEEIFAENCEIARWDKTSYWTIYNPQGNQPNPGFGYPPDTGKCKPHDLKLHQNEFVRTGQEPLWNPQYNLFVEQKNDGNFVVRQGNDILWESGVSRKIGDYFTKLQGDGNVITYKGRPGYKGERVWKSGFVGPSMLYFLGLSCDGKSIAVYQGAPNDPGNTLWEVDVNGVSPPPPPSPVAPDTSCDPIYLSLASKTVILTDTPFYNADHDIHLEQLSNGALVVKKGDTIVWQSFVSNAYGGVYHTKLQGDGNLITYEGTPEERGERVWKTNSVGPSTKEGYFLGLNCEDLKTVGIYMGTPDNVGPSLWTSKRETAPPQPMQPTGSTLTVPFDASALAFSDYIENSSDNKGNCAEGPVDARKVTDSTSCVSQCAVGWTEGGEALMYDIRVNSGGPHDISVLIASARTDKKFRLRVDGNDGPLWYGPGDGWNDYVEYIWDGVNLSSGQHRVEILFVNGQVNVCSISIR